MGRKVKLGKTRKDYYYNLAKSQGFRARSAFKLTQIAHKFNLFNNVLNVIDLCAAPGGWMQVTKQALPVSGLVIGVDLVPIKPIKGCISIQADITTSRCQKLIDNVLVENNIIDKKVDLVLHDGAPNVGTSWTKDAYVQNELVLKSLELATKYLRPNGDFFTKVFRSESYTQLLFVFSKLFNSYHATKPSSSRNVSAEIFVLCRGYKAPKIISKAFFDINKVFENTEVNKIVLPIFSSELLQTDLKSALKNSGLSKALKLQSKKSKTDYQENDEYRKCYVHQFFLSKNPAELLLSLNLLNFDDRNDLDVAIKNSKCTTEEILQYLSDLKLLGPNEYSKILKWKQKVTEELLMNRKNSTDLKNDIESLEKDTSQISVSDDENQENMDDKQLETLLERKLIKKKKIEKQKAKKLAKIKDKMNRAKTLFDGFQADENLFSNAEESRKILELEDEFTNSSDSDIQSNVIDNDSNKKNELKNLTLTKKINIFDKNEHLQRTEVELEMTYNDKKKRKILSDMERANSNKKLTRREIVRADRGNEMKEFIEQAEKNLTNAFVDSDSDDVIDILHKKKSEFDEDESDDVKEMPENKIPIFPLNEKKKRHLRFLKKIEEENKKYTLEKEKEKKLLGELGDIREEINSKSKNRKLSKPIDIIKKNVIVEELSDDEKQDILNIGIQLSKKSSRMEIIDNTYSRWNFNDKNNLPEWFKENDSCARKVDMPITKEISDMYSRKIKEISNRPIRKVLEAKARKKKSLNNKIRNIKNQIESLSDKNELSNKTKSIAVDNLQKKILKLKSSSKDKNYVITSKSGKHKVSYSNNRNKKAFTVNVDKRMKKDKRKKQTVVRKSRKRF